MHNGRFGFQFPTRALRLLQKTVQLPVLVDPLKQGRPGIYREGLNHGDTLVRHEAARSCAETPGNGVRRNDGKTQVRVRCVPEILRCDIDPRGTSTFVGKDRAIIRHK